MKTDIQSSWDKNAEEWNRVIESNKILSRKFTNKAIVNMLAELNVSKNLDCGCGEGWLTREITALGKIAVGIDGTKKLISKAKKKGKESFYTIRYEEIMDGKTIPEHPYDAVVFNFCLYQEKGLSLLLKKIKNHLRPKGLVIIQTLHPGFILQNSHGYYSQWFTDSWKGLPGKFTDGHSWYARTFEDWAAVFKASNLKIVNLKEITSLDKQPLSILYTLQ